MALAKTGAGGFGGSGPSEFTSASRQINLFPGSRGSAAGAGAGGAATDGSTPESDPFLRSPGAPVPGSGFRGGTGGGTTPTTPGGIALSDTGSAVSKSFPDFLKAIAQGVGFVANPLSIGPALVGAGAGVQPGGSGTLPTTEQMFSALFDKATGKGGAPVAQPNPVAGVGAPTGAPTPQQSAVGAITPAGGPAGQGAGAPTQTPTPAIDTQQPSGSEGGADRAGGTPFSTDAPGGTGATGGELGGPGGGIGGDTLGGPATGETPGGIGGAVSGVVNGAANDALGAELGTGGWDPTGKSAGEIEAHAEKGAGMPSLSDWTGWGGALGDGPFAGMGGTPGTGVGGDGVPAPTGAPPGDPTPLTIDIFPSGWRNNDAFAPGPAGGTGGAVKGGAGGDDLMGGPGIGTAVDSVIGGIMGGNLGGFSISDLTAGMEGVGAPGGGAVNDPGAQAAGQATADATTAADAGSVDTSTDAAGFSDSNSNGDDY